MNKQEIRAAKNLHRAKKHGVIPPRKQVDCACVIHGTAYDWIYVERLYNMVCRNISSEVRFHVYTEHDRSVPPHMIKHVLEDWPGISGPRKSWWYKMQLFNPQHHAGDLLYFDLDVVICNDIQWIVEESTEHFWTIRDFRYLQRTSNVTMNSSLMWWNVAKFDWVWTRFTQCDLQETIRRYPGDQDYLHAMIDHNMRRFYPQQNVQSWRWQAHDGGYNFSVRKHKSPGAGTRVDPETSVLIFHGRPKPHQIDDAFINQFWR